MLAEILHIQHRQQEYKPGSVHPLQGFWCNLCKSVPPWSILHFPARHASIIMPHLILRCLLCLLIPANPLTRLYIISKMESPVPEYHHLSLGFLLSHLWAPPVPSFLVYPTLLHSSVYSLPGTPSSPYYSMLTVQIHPPAVIFSCSCAGDLTAPEPLCVSEPDLNISS